MFCHCRGKQPAEPNGIEMDAKLNKALKEDSVDAAIVVAELKAMNDDVMDHSNKR